ncbi:6-phospho-beta-galactosidase [Anaerosalibacter massiliensis]|uniref:6-phospho-beta-galactosidase n=2 Tax=Anaerosalibacter massiliensis TaxID=1347392 RepID=A0A9X2MIP3_9FIRM|nr:6-phospho-beta-galactosidase [Anaerosalibacter massiliensis]MCR2044439.1 6-phospho-beta-galactosidase [Anaerosalibacter massiliensis]
MRAFDSNFIFGGATAAYQAEGAVNIDGRGPCYWDEYLHRPESRYNGDIASDFYHKYKEDLQLSKDFGVNGIRISIAWTRIIPDGKGEINLKGIDYYNKLIDECLKNGIEPFVTLHHFDTPLPLYKEGDWLNRENIEHFVRFARVCFENFGDRVKKWITINEPLSLALGQYVIGHFPPNIRYDIPKSVQAMHNMMVAHSKVVELYKSMDLKGEIGIVHILQSKYPISESEEDKRAAYLEDILANRFMLDACLGGGYQAETLKVVQDILKANNGSLEIEPNDMEIIKSAAGKNDFLGVNYYASDFLAHYDGETEIRHNGTGDKGTLVFRIKGIGERVINNDIPATDWDWPIYPKGLYDMLMSIKNDYPKYKTIYVTENGLGYKDNFENGKIYDDERIDYVKNHMDAILDAIEDGVNVQGYFIWSLMDLLSWTNGFNKRYGLFYVDYDTQDRYPKKSAYWWKKVSENKKLIDSNEIDY